MVNKRIFVSLCIGLMFIVLNAQKTLSASFSADVLWKMKGMPERYSRLYMSDNLYRFDTVQDEQSLGFIIDQKTDKAIILNLTKRVYSEGSRADTMMGNPFEAHFAMRSMYKVVDEGEEILNDVKCYKQALKMNKIVVQRVWISKKYNFPVKIVTYNRDKVYMLVELSNIKEEAVSKDVFLPPGDFKHISLAEAEAKERSRKPRWLVKIIERVPDAPVLKPPFKRVMKKGDLLRAKYTKGTVIKFKATGKSDIQYVAFKDGEYVDTLGQYSGDSYKEAEFSSLPDGANEIVVNAKDGKFTLEAVVLDQ